MGENHHKFGKGKFFFSKVLIFFKKLPLSCTNDKPDKNPKPDSVKPEPDFQNWQKPDPSPNPTV